jgi:hypothetical protein
LVGSKNPKKVNENTNRDENGVKTGRATRWDFWVEVLNQE